MRKYYEEDYSRIPEAPAFTVEINDKVAGLEGYVCIHSMGRFGASGGMRCVPDVTKTEVQLLAKAMTYKYSFWNIEQGGAKAGLVIPYDCSNERKGELYQRAAVHLEPLVKSGVWSPWSDMNFYGQDLAVFYAGMDIDYVPSKGGSSERTAISAFATLKATVEHLGILPSKARIAIEGFGSVAHFLAKHLKEYGAKIVAVSNHEGCIANSDGLDIDFLIERRESGRTDWVRSTGPWDNLEREKLFSVPCDILVPGARVHSIDDKIASRLDAKALVPTANVPCTESALAVLDKRSIPYIPDFVVNGGGVCGHIWGGHSNGEPISAFVKGFESMVGRMLRESSRTGKSAREIAGEIAHRNYGAIAKDAYRREGRLIRVVRELQKRYLLPGNPERKVQELRVERTLSLIESAFR